MKEVDRWTNRGIEGIIHKEIKKFKQKTLHPSCYSFIKPVPFLQSICSKITTLCSITWLHLRATVHRAMKARMNFMFVGSFSN